MSTAPERAADDPIGPIPPGERILDLDVLRGFALLGILVINMPGFNTPDAAWGLARRPFPGPLDRAAEWLVDFLGSGKFNAIFSFLFGVGLTIQLERAAAKGRPFVGMYLRRLAALFAFGAAHCLLIWNGDVLHIYAILGLGLLLLLRVADRWVLALAALLLLAHIGHGAYELYLDEPPEHPQSYYAERAEEQVRIFRDGTYAQMVRERARETRKGYVEHGAGWFFATMSVTMLLGFVAGRRRIFQDLPAHLPMIRRLAGWALGLGLALALAFATCAALAERGKTSVFGSLAEMFYELNRPTLCLFYIAAVVLLLRRPGWSQRLAPLASVGRMPLTNYLMQSVLCTTIYYSYGLALFGRVGPALGLAVAALVYTVQVLYSNWWMARFRFGPMEWLWRAIAYGRMPAMRAAEGVAAPA